MSTLDERDLEVLAFEKQWWQHPGSKDQAIRDLFGITPTRYYQLLTRLLERPEALAAEPVVVGRLRRVREQQAQRRRIARSA